MSDENREDRPSEGEGGSDSESRTTYTKPALTKYGQVRFLTKGGSPGSGDGVLAPGASVKRTELVT